MMRAARRAVAVLVPVTLWTPALAEGGDRFATIRAHPAGWSFPVSGASRLVVAGLTRVRQHIAQREQAREWDGPSR